MPKAPKTLLDKIIVDKALDRASRLRQQYLERGLKPSRLKELEDELIENLDPIAKKWKPSMRRRSRGIRDIMESGRFKNQFETESSGGLLDGNKRLMISDDYFNDPEPGNNFAREKYGFLKRPKKYGYDDVNWYGDYEVTFKPAVRKRMTFTNGDSLNQWDVAKYSPQSSTPIVPGVPETYINWAGQPVDDVSAVDRDGLRLVNVLDDLKFYHRPTFGKDNYVEAQYHGPLTINDVEGVRFPTWKLTPENSDHRLFMKSSDQYGFPLYDWDGKCIYNCR